MNRRKSRESAFLILFEMLFNQSTFEEILENAKITKEIECDEFSLNIIKGVIKNKEQLDMLIQDNIKNWKIDRISKVSLILLRVAIYEIIFELDIPDSVSINEAVELCKTYSTKDDSSFINGVLGSIEKKKSDEKIV